jgi:hypothetical protein
MFNSHRYVWLLPIMVIALILSSVIPSPVLADGDPPTPVDTPVVAVTPEGPTVVTPNAVVPPEGPTQEPISSSNSDGGTPQSAGDNLDSQNGTDVVITADGADEPSNQLVTKLPIWCPSGVEPVPGENGCTAEFGSISLLMDYINTSNLGTDGKIWISDLTQPDNTVTQPEQTQTDAGAADNNDGASEPASGVNIVILDAQGNSLPLNSVEGANTLLNGQPVWCPDGITPYDAGESCTTSSASLGLLVSMMENGSNVNGAIYIQANAGLNAEVNNSTEDTQSQNINVDITPNPVLQSTDEINADGQDGNENAAVDNTAAVDESAPSIENQVEKKDSPPDPILSDPIWCSNAVVAPDPLDPLCTPSQLDLLSLVSYLMLPGNEPAAAGTIWMEKSPPNDGSSGTIVIDGNIFTTWRNFSLTLQGGWSGTAGDPSITGSTTFSQAISVTNWLNDVSVSDVVIQNTASTGLHVFTTGDIGLNNIASTGNALDGVFVHNDTTGSTGNVTVTGTNNISNNLDDGLIIRSKGDIVTNQITATGNGDVGAYFRNNTGTGNILLTGTNIFSNNGSNTLGEYRNGLKLDTNGSIDINNITASNNFKSGTDFRTSTDSVTLTGTNSFIGNRGSGLGISITNGGSIDLQNITARNNTSNGASLAIGAGVGSGLVNISGANVFNNNSSAGLSVSTYGDMVLSNIDASGNTGGASGARLGTACNITINSSTFNNNAAYGFDDSLSLPTYPASIALNSVTFSGNALGAYLVNNPNTVIPATSTYPCTVLGNTSLNTSLKAVLAQPIVLPLNTVSMPGLGDSNSVDLNCAEFSGTVLVLANGDQVRYMCPTMGQVSLIHVEEDGENFPGALPANLVFTSAMETHLSEAGIDQPLTSGDLIVSFVIPVDIAGFDFAILYFDGSNWLDLSTATFSDGKLVSNGGFKTENGMFEATTNFTGLFVLARK